MTNHHTNGKTPPKNGARPALFTAQLTHNPFASLDKKIQLRPGESEMPKQDDTSQGNNWGAPGGDHRDNIRQLGAKSATTAAAPAGTGTTERSTMRSQHELEASAEPVAAAPAAALAETPASGTKDVGKPLITAKGAGPQRSVPPPAPVRAAPATASTPPAAPLKSDPAPDQGPPSAGFRLQSLTENAGGPKTPRSVSHPVAGKTAVLGSPDPATVKPPSVPRPQTKGGTSTAPATSLESLEQDTVEYRKRYDLALSERATARERLASCREDIENLEAQIANSEDQRAQLKEARERSLATLQKETGLLPTAIADLTAAAKTEAAQREAAHKRAMTLIETEQKRERDELEAATTKKKKQRDELEARNRELDAEIHKLELANGTKLVTIEGTKQVVAVKQSVRKTVTTWVLSISALLLVLFGVYLAFFWKSEATPKSNVQVDTAAAELLSAVPPKAVARTNMQKLGPKNILIPTPSGNEVPFNAAKGCYKWDLNDVPYCCTGTPEPSSDHPGHTVLKTCLPE